MIKSFTLQAGRTPHTDPEIIATEPITVFVGPNNSGKSKVLAEIYQYCSKGHRPANNVLIKDIQFEGFDQATAEARIKEVTLAPLGNETPSEGEVIVGKRGHRSQVPRQPLLAALQDPNGRTSHFCTWYLQYNTLILDGTNRINLVQQQTAGDLLQSPNTSFQFLLGEDDKRAEVRRIIHDAFGVYAVIDPTNMSHLRLKLSERPPSTDSEERRWDAEAVEFFRAASPIDDAGDGIKAFTGMIIEIIAGDPAILLIDEPEAFMHPSLSFRLGKEVARATAGSEKKIFASTHSADFLMGCIQSGAPVNIVRLTYRNGAATARILPNDKLLKLMRNPLLRSTGVLGGLFYESVVVTEADTDRAFYDEVNERLLRSKPECGIPHCLFLRGQNKQSVRTIVKPLRELGIPTAAIVDVDIVKEGGTVWSDFLGSGFVPEIEREPLSRLRDKVKQKLKATGKDMKSDGGVALLDADDREAAENLFNRLAEYGLFVVRRGELESWVSGLGATGHGPSWLIDVFERMGEDPETASYVKPAEGDVWEFITQLRAWLMNSERKGIPS